MKNKKMIYKKKKKKIKNKNLKKPKKQDKIYLMKLYQKKEEV